MRDTLLCYCAIAVAIFANLKASSKSTGALRSPAWPRVQVEAPPFNAGVLALLTYRLREIVSIALDSYVAHASQYQHGLSAVFQQRWATNLGSKTTAAGSHDGACSTPTATELERS